MINKDQFTETIKEKAKMAKMPVAPLTSTEVVDGYAAIIKTATNEFGYDLRAPSIKGVLSPNHPVLIAANLNQNNDEVHSDILSKLAELHGYKHCELIEQSDSKAEELYTSADKLSNKCDRKNPCSIELGDNKALLLFNSENDLKGKKLDLTQAWLSYFEFLFHILLNNGFGRIADIERILKENSPSEFNINGAWVEFKTSKTKEDFLNSGLLVNDKCFEDGVVKINIPTSIYDEQIIEITNKLKELI